MDVGGGVSTTTGDAPQKRQRADDTPAVVVSESALHGRERRDPAATVAMPDSFTELLGDGGRAVPDEAKDIEDVVHGHLDFSEIDGTRRAAILLSVKRLHDKVIRLLQQAVPGPDGTLRLPGPRNTASSSEGVNSISSSSSMHRSASAEDLSSAIDRLVMKHSRLPGVGDTAKKSELTAAYRVLVRSGEVPPNAVLEAHLVRKKGKSHSGVLVVTVFMGPGQFSCPKDCYYCPNQPGIARSYLLKEPGVLRGFRNRWDPILQFCDRASALENNGHVVDKIELIILGGTFSFYPHQYVEEFIQASFFAANTYYDAAPLRPMMSLTEELTANETARCRIIGVTAETRPDFITNSELRRFRSLGITRVQLGIQHLDDAILELIHRECPTAKTVVAIQRLLDAGFKVDAHWMPDLPGSSYEKDLEMFQLLFSPENERFQVDQWKVYPTAVVPFTTIEAWYKEGRYRPYAEEENGKYMVKLLLYIMQNCPERIRLNRIIRDIPTTYIMGGERRCNLRQVIEAEMKAQSLRCRDIRERECKGAPIDRSRAKIFVDEFRASEGTEFYISMENEGRTSLYGHLRLRLRDDASIRNSILPALENAALIRELHTYGKLVAVSASNTGKETQHVGVGTELMKRAEDLSRERGFLKTAVIAGIGVRKYYEKLGYRLQDTYMIKELQDPSAVVITEALIAADDDNDLPTEVADSLMGAVAQTLSAVGGAAAKLWSSITRR